MDKNGLLPFCHGISDCNIIIIFLSRKTFFPTLAAPSYIDFWTYLVRYNRLSLAHRLPGKRKLASGIKTGERKWKIKRLSEIVNIPSSNQANGDHFNAAVDNTTYFINTRVHICLLYTSDAADE